MASEHDLGGGLTDEDLTDLVRAALRVSKLEDENRRMRSVLEALRDDGQANGIYMKAPSEFPRTNPTNTHEPIRALATWGLTGKVSS